MKVNILKIKNMDMENLHGLMEEFIKFNLNLKGAWLNGK